MNVKNLSYIGIIIILTIIVPIFYSFTGKGPMILATIKTPHDAIALFPRSVSDMQSRLTSSLTQAKQEIENIIAIPHEQRTYTNTAHAFDMISSFCNATINASLFNVVEMLNQDQQLRDAAHDALLQVNNFYIDMVSGNQELYNACKAYVEGNALKENLDDEQWYFLHETIKDFERAGLGLPYEQLEHVKNIRKELAQVELEFSKNIAQDTSSIEVSKEALAGLDEDFIASFKKNAAGNYIIGVDYPTYAQVTENCTNATTREQLWIAYQNRAYPANKNLLQTMIAKRSELAKLLGFKTYAALELDSQMVQTPDRAQSFISELEKKAQKKAMIEFKQFTQQLPKSVQLTAQGKFNPWDAPFVRNQYKKSKLNVDENAIAEYFPMQKTVDGLLEIYQKFFNLSFTQLPSSGLWDTDVRLIEIFDNTKHQRVGYLFLDLFPRPNKYSHACQVTIVPVIADSTPNLGVASVIANFPKPMPNKPSLLHLKDVTTFFHEFGHALHAMLGRTSIASFSGTRVKYDFVEMPSQMLEEWLWNPEILKMVSGHYQTGEPLPDNMIKQIIAARTFDVGLFLARQLFFASLSLAYFNDGPTLDIDALYKNLYEKIIRSTQFNPSDHGYASFSHLTEYGSRYYGYMWSKVFALDLFETINKEGLLNPITGRRYVDTVIGKGGSQDPNDLLKDFLGRNPNQAAFLHEMGLETATP